ncbi:MAG: hypothetical protein LBL90_12140, partial [Prevotellaceae bacterium]|nr:hypothetical protein [Prevotellaceae bacterium]
YLFDNYVDTLKQNVVVFKKIAYPYVLSAWSTDVWNIETGELKHLPLKQEKFYYDSLTRWVASSFEIKDAVLVNNEELRLLLYIDNTYCIKDIRLHDMQFVHEKELYIPQKRQSGVYFYGTDKLLYMSEEKLLMLYI